MAKPARTTQQAILEALADGLTNEDAAKRVKGEFPASYVTQASVNFYRQRPAMWDSLER